MTYGSLYITGSQFGTPSGSSLTAIGPFAVAASGVADVQTVTVNTSASISVPSLAAGAILIPPAAGTVAWSYKTTSGDTGIHGNQSLPTFLNFDSANQPTTLYFTSASSVAITVQFL